MSVLTTKNLQLIAFTEAHYQAMLANDTEMLRQLLNCAPFERWTEYEDAREALPVVYQFFQDLKGDWRWGSFFIIHNNCLAGNCGFKGMPDAQNSVEIGYEIHPLFQGQGWATEAAKALVELAFSAGVTAVKAHTYESTNASANVLRKAGFQLVGPVHDPDEGLLWAWICKV